MPIEISEIGVRVAVVERIQSLSQDSGTPHDSDGAGNTPEISAEMLDLIIKQCVRSVIETLRMAQGR